MFTREKAALLALVLSILLVALGGFCDAIYNIATAGHNPVITGLAILVGIASLAVIAAIISISKEGR